MAYAEVAGLSPVNGLYALLLPDRRLRAARLLAAADRRPGGLDLDARRRGGAAARGGGEPEAAELAAMLALLVAACFALAWVLRLGWIADYFSRPVLIGYIHGVAVVLIIGQLGKLLGLSIDAREPLAQLWEVLSELGSVSGPTVARRRGLARGAARAALPACRSCPRRCSSSSAAIALSWALDLQAHGVAVVGEIPAGLPSFELPSPAWQDVARSSCRRRSASSSSRSPTRS